MSSTSKEVLLHKLETRTARVAVIGLGYVGLPLAVAFAEAGYATVGIDLDESKVDLLNQGGSYLDDLPAERLRAIRLSDGAQRFIATTDLGVLAECDAVSISVPTPLGKTGDPDVSYILQAARDIDRWLHAGMVIVLESTTYPGTTQELLLPEVTRSHPDLVAGRDFFLAFSPERIDPGRTDWTLQNMPKVIGGVTVDCLEVARALYAPVAGSLVSVSSTDAAEMVKLFENTFRAVNIALANELLLICDRLGLNAWEILEAAATKPFGFMKFTPGPGLGGHCIPVDPHYLSWKLRSLEYSARFIDLAHEINAGMPSYWVQVVQDRLNDEGKAVRGSRILVLGVAYKKNVDDTRESPALDILDLLEQKGAHVSYHDPHVSRFRQSQDERTCVEDLDAALRAADAVVIVTDHDAYDWARIGAVAQLVVDTRHVMPA